MTFRRMLMKRAYWIEDIRRMMAAAGWQDLRPEVTPIGFEAWIGISNEHLRDVSCVFLDELGKRLYGREGIEA